MVELLNSGDNKITISLPNKSGELLLPGTSIWIEKSGLGITQGNSGITGKNGAMNLYEPKAEEAREIAKEAMASADGKAVVWRTTTQPPIQGSKSGDIWFNTSDDTIWVFDGSIWVLNSINGNSIKALSIAKDKLDNELTSELDDLDENLGILDEELQGLNLRYEELETDFNNLQIGGRNLILDSANFPGLSGYMGSNVEAEIITHEVKGIERVVQKVHTTGGTHQLKYLFQSDGLMEFDTDYTISFFVKNIGTTRLVVMVNGLIGASPSTYYINPGEENDIVFSGKRRVGYAWFQIKFEAVDIEKDLQFIITPLMLEKGTKPTDWTPAPEDTEQAIAAVMTTANGKNKSYFSTSAPGTTSGTALGDIWYQRNSSGQIIGQWELTALPNTWTSRQITDSVIATLSAAKITTGTLDAERIGAGTITANHLGTDSVTANKIQAGAVTTNKIAAGAITAESAILANASVLTANIGDLQVTGAKIADATITNAKISNLDASKITAGVIDVQRLRLENFSTVSGKTKIDNNGKLITEELVATNANISGNITAVTGKIGDLKIDNMGLSHEKVESGITYDFAINAEEGLMFGTTSSNYTSELSYKNEYIEGFINHSSLGRFGFDVDATSLNFRKGVKTTQYPRESLFSSERLSFMNYGDGCLELGTNGIELYRDLTPSPSSAGIYIDDIPVRPIITGSYIGNGNNGRNITIAGLTRSSEVIIIDASTYAALGKKPISTNILQVSAVSGENISGRMYRYIAIII